MELKKIIIVIVGVLFLMSVPATSNGFHLILDEPTERARSIHIIELNLNSIYLAQNEPEAAESESQPTNENKEQSTESGAEDKEKSGNISKEAETKPIKPFKPSEEIAAEQAVDFPVDI